MVKERAALPDVVIEKLNKILFEATYKANTSLGMRYATIHAEDFGEDNKVPLPLIAAILTNAGWNARYESCQRDGSWVHVDLPVIPVLQPPQKT